MTSSTTTRLAAIPIQVHHCAKVSDVVTRILTLGCEELLKDPSAMQGREQTRANYFARADVSDPQQRQILESYLLAPDRSATELQTFAGLFPNANFMISHNLLTSSATPDHKHIVRRDQESLRTVNAWLADPRFNHLQLQIQTIQKRLSQFVEQARSNQ